MSAASINPVAVTATTSLTEIANTAVASGEEWSIDVRATNIAGVNGTYKLAIGLTGNPGSAKYRVFNYAVKKDAAVDIERQLTLTSGWALFHSANANSTVDVTVTGRKRSTS